MSEGFDRDLTNAVEELSGQVRAFKRQLHINRTWRRVLTSLIVLKAVTIIVLVVVIVNLADTQNKEQVTRSQVLCPLYKLFVQAVDAPRAVGETNDQYKQRVAAQKQFHDGYAVLGCSPTLP